MLENWLAAEALIIDRLKAKVPEAKLVQAMPELDIENVAQKCPALIVIYQGDRLSDSALDGQVMIAEQIWSVVVVVKNVKDIAQGAASRVEAGLLMTKAIKALSGWQPNADFKTGLTRINAGGAGYLAGVSWFPLAFKVATYSIGDGNE